MVTVDRASDNTGTTDHGKDAAYSELRTGGDAYAWWWRCWIGRWRGHLLHAEVVYADLAAEDGP